MLVTIKKKNSSRKGNVISGLLLALLLFLLYFWSSNIHKTQSNEYYKELSDIQSYSESFFKDHKESGFKERELIQFENDIFDKWNYSVEVKTNLNEENKKESPYFSLDLYTQNGYGKKIKVENFFYE